MGKSCGLAAVPRYIIGSWGNLRVPRQGLLDQNPLKFPQWLTDSWAWTVLVP
jgi:hypothetical protein